MKETEELNEDIEEVEDIEDPEEVEDQEIQKTKKNTKKPRSEKQKQALIKARETRKNNLENKKKVIPKKKIKQKIIVSPDSSSCLLSIFAFPSNHLRIRRIPVQIHLYYL